MGETNGVVNQALGDNGEALNKARRQVMWRIIDGMVRGK